MRLIRTSGVAMMTDLLELEDDAGRRIEIARPTSGYFSASAYSSQNDEVYSWRARLYAGSWIEVTTSCHNASGDTSQTIWYGRDATGAMATIDAPPAMAEPPLDEVGG